MSVVASLKDKLFSKRPPIDIHADCMILYTCKVHVWEVSFCHVINIQKKPFKKYWMLL